MAGRGRGAAGIRSARRGLLVTVTDARGRRAGGGALGRWLARAAPLGARGAVTVALVPDRTMRRLNRTYRQADYATDVLSFPVRRADLQVRRAPGLAFDGHRAPRARRGVKARPTYGGERTSNALGDIAIATGVARRQAREHGHTLTTEVRLLALHGLLHLLGYDHESDRGEMARVEDRLRRRSGLPRGLVARASRGAARR